MTSLPQTIEVETQTNPNSAVIWLHGLGADGSDFEPIVPALQLAAPIRFVFPNAPVRPVTINNGMRMPAWYDILAMGGAQEDEDGIRQSENQLLGLIEREISRGMRADRIVIAGFSQGGAIALQTALRYPGSLAGVMALSTYLPLAATLTGEKQAPAKLPILMVHGQHDEMISLSRASDSRDAIEAAGYSVQWQEYPMGHEVCHPEIELISRWLTEVLPG
ncbi:MAG: alpha/beta hydrolase [Burkholderiaceae bacterium]